MSPAEARETVHATCLVLGEDGILIRGEPGAGKSSLALRLLDEADSAGRHARLVGDDRVTVERRHGRLIAHPHPALIGMIEIRGLGPCRLAHHAPAARLSLIVDLVETLPRLPPHSSASATILAVALPRLALERRQPLSYLICEALTALRQETPQGIVSSRSHSSARLLGGGVAL